jgi:NADPH2:quinone reductase
MRAFVFAEHGNPDEVLRLQELSVPRPGPGQVLVATRAAAVNFADHLMITGEYQSRPALPAVAGMELAGAVAAAGSGVDIPAGTLVAGLTTGMIGAFAEYAVLDTTDAMVPPAGFSAVEAACFTVAYQTAWFALHVRAKLSRGERVLVQAAAGGVGLATVQLAKAAGAHVVGIVGSPTKVEQATRAGCDLVLVRGRDDVVGAVKAWAPSGIDVVVDPVGGQAQAVSERVVGFEGRIVLVGMASGEPSPVRPEILLVKNVALVGLHWGLYRSRAPQVVVSEYDRLVASVTAAGLKPLVSHVHPFHEVREALANVRSGATTGRVAVLVRGERP